MARPQRNNVDYFPFLCEDGKKMFYLEETYGNDGFATFVKILRELAKTDYHYLDLSEKSTIMFLSAKCKVSVNTLESIINDLSDLGKFDKNLWIENRIIWCNDFIQSIQDAYIKRSNNCIDYNSLISLLISKGIRKPPKSIRKPLKRKLKGEVNPQSKEEDNKEDKKKPDYKIKDDEVFFTNEAINNMFHEYLKLRVKEKFTMSKLVTDRLIKKLREYSNNNIKDATELVMKAITGKWKDFYPLK